MGAYWKIPLQALVLMVGVSVFVYYEFVRPPLLFNPAHEADVVADRGATYDALEARYAEMFTLRETAARGVVDAGDQASASAAMQAFLAREAEVQVIRGEALAQPPCVVARRRDSAGVLTSVRLHLRKCSGSLKL
jgi:hypothetical protein